MTSDSSFSGTLFVMEHTVPSLALAVKTSLELEGIHVHWDDAHTTGSVYLDLDHGLLGSIRVSDHKSKGNGFQLEIGSHIKDTHTIDKYYMGATYVVKKFPASEVEALTEEVMIRRLHLKAKVGNDVYEEQVRLSDQECRGREVHPSRGRRKSRARASD